MMEGWNRGTAHLRDSFNLRIPRYHEEEPWQQNEAVKRVCWRVLLWGFTYNNNPTQKAVQTEQWRLIFNSMQLLKRSRSPPLLLIIIGEKMVVKGKGRKQECLLRILLCSIWAKKKKKREKKGGQMVQLPPFPLEWLWMPWLTSHTWLQGWLLKADAGKPCCNPSLVSTSSSTLGACEVWQLSP